MSRSNEQQHSHISEHADDGPKAFYAADKLTALLLTIDTADLEALRALWKQQFGSPVPKLRSVEILRLMLAFRLQEDRFGGVDQVTKRQLKKKRPVQVEGLGLGLGARLRRTWKGRQVEVIVEETGFRYDGELYKSLSAAATAIAGTRWNGPRFFGLRGQEAK